ncbi:EthD family reductase [Leucobacter massiliensis]|uniref:Ethyl tert-butyl ether degradation protein EthD n=1 Tax=Leucobacter massiliensis TaxID=1686285 RepID=A0A2S9QLC4_9MICO|nr:EthD family reductase [Leucobacter massiliensis]PRI10395.1 ethyl tert-butyl ether degradation protein EthD [Leucobacter massiliensis]
MHQLTVLYPAPDDPAAFVAYYESTHLPLAAQLPGLRSWHASTDIQPGPDGAPAPYFAIFEAVFDSAEALREAMASPVGQAVAADVPNYASGGAVLIDFPITGGSPS